MLDFYMPHIGTYRVLQIDGDAIPSIFCYTIFKLMKWKINPNEECQPM
jgi:hypothetical protein